METRGTVLSEAKTSRLRPLLKLCRIYLAPTALADSFAGFALASIFLRPQSDPLVLMLISATSVLLYCAGMVTNDLFDARRDRVHSPNKPIPKGDVAPITALGLALLLAAAALACAFVVSATIVATAILVLALAYNAGGKRAPVVGNLLMGGCRAGNLLLGAVAAGGHAALLEGAVIGAATLLGAFVAVVTAISVLENKPGARRSLLGLGLSTLAVPIVLLAVDPRSVACWVGCAVLTLQLLLALAATFHPPPGVPPAAVFVRRALGAIPSVDAAIVLAFAPELSDALIPAACLYGIGLFAWWCKRRWLQSGGPET